MPFHPFRMLRITAPVKDHIISVHQVSYQLICDEKPSRYPGLPRSPRDASFLWMSQRGPTPSCQKWYATENLYAILFGVIAMVKVTI
jgi:hypothetical protein